MKLFFTFICLPFFINIFAGFLYSDQFIYDSHEKKDPFAPPVLSDVNEADSGLYANIKVEGIIWDENDPIAIIDNELIRVGDEVRGGKVAGIEENEVIFDIQGQEIRIKLHKEDE